MARAAISRALPGIVGAVLASVIACGCSDAASGSADGGADMAVDTGPDWTFEVRVEADVIDDVGFPGVWEPEVDAGPTPPELCTNGEDDDSDGLVDCLDPDCAGRLECREDCGDGIDNDGDGLTDFDDTDCASAPDPPRPDTCSTMYLCLIEQGCDCTLGIDCPVGDAARPCEQSCRDEPVCYISCLGDLELDTQQSWGYWDACTSAHCAGLEGDAFEACFVSECIEEYGACFTLCGDTAPRSKDVKANKTALVECMVAQCGGLATESDVWECVLQSCPYEGTQCLYNGDATCEEGYFGCILECPGGDEECAGDCARSLSSEGAYDLFAWTGCTTTICDGDGDGVADSPDCDALSFLACADLMGSCNGDGWTGEDACMTTIDCVIGCGALGPQAATCVEMCEVGLSPSSAGPVSAVLSCAIGACGTTAEPLSGECIQAALDGGCAAEATVCANLDLPGEDCEDGADNDEDGAIDCADTDCAAVPACIFEICDNGIDDDGNDETDCDDPACADAPVCM